MSAFDEIWGAGQVVRKGVQNAFDQSTFQRAGNALAGGDTQGGMNALNRGGMLDEASKLGEQQYRNDALKARAAEQQREQQAAERKQRGEFFIRAADAIGQIPDDGTQAGRRQALQQLVPTFKAMGIGDQDIQALMSADLSDQSLAMFKGSVAQQLKIIEGPDGIYGVNERTGATRRLQGYPQKPIEIDPTKDLYVPSDQGGGAAPAAPATAQAAPTASGFDAHIGPMLQREGGYVARDGRSGAPANFGINQKYNPDVDVSKLTADQAKEIYRSRYWNAIGGDQLPPEAQAAVFDAAVNQGPQRAMQWWQQAGGDLGKFNELRLQHYRSRPDYAQNRASWEGRVAETGGGAAPLQGGAGADALGGGIPGFTRVQRGQPKSEWETLSAQEAAGFGPGQYQRNARTGEVKQVSGTAPKGTTGRLPAAALNLQNDHLSAIQTASAINTRLDAIGKQLETGALNLGPVTNLMDRARNAVGQSNDQSRNFASFRANLEKLRNDSLRLNKGVQTEGDAQRAWGELMANLNDEGVVRQRLDEIEGYNRQALAFHQDAVTQLREDAGLPPIDTTRFQAKPISAPQARPAPSGGRGSAQPRAPAPPKPGAVVKGYRYKGGDPSKQSSWQKV